MKPHHLFDHHLQAAKVAAPAIGEEPGGYIPLPRRNVCAGEALPFDVYLKLKLTEPLQSPFVLAVPRGMEFAEDWHRKLAELEINWLYYSQEDEGRVLEYLDGYLESVLLDEALETKAKVALLYDTTLIWIRNFFTRGQVEPAAQLHRAMRLMDSLFNLGAGKDRFFLPILELRRHDHFLYNHSLNVCFLGMAFVSHLGWEAGKARDFGLGAMLHDIGLTQMRKENGEANGFQDNALNPITQHPVLGFRILSKFPHLRREVKKMALQHHENGDGTGYPAGLRLHEIEPWARILRILDHYDNTQRSRSRLRAPSAQETIRDMIALQENKVFDMHYLMAFIKFLGKI